MYPSIAQLDACSEAIRHISLNTMEENLDLSNELYAIHRVMTINIKHLMEETKWESTKKNSES